MLESYPYVSSDTTAYECSAVHGYIKSKRSQIILDQHVNRKYKCVNRHFWCREYCIDTVEKYENVTKEYIRSQLKEDIATQLA